MTPAENATAPSLRRRLACLFYESFLVFGLLMIAGFAHFAATRQPFDPDHSNGAGLVALLVLTVYFSWCWSRGQSLAMKTWYITVRDSRTGRPPRPARALLRFAAAWTMFLPAMASGLVLDLTSQRRWFYIAVLINVLACALLSRFLPGRQYLHDRLAGTELISTKA